MLAMVPFHQDTKKDTFADEVSRTRRAMPLKDRLVRFKALAEALGPSDPTFDMKTYTDGMWEGG
ncbi:histidinol dehydrogenase [Skermanella stibiiresistens SB22]|uniref:Histidinol dehydrogenase n=1 Tax=Skermanella stibiiresistens SB22 TaxID=1385369 RepID=W9H6Z9_9PROT|nr:histidinol dehydrogenase [Skermanella stibiiresistens SB22]